MPLLGSGRRYKSKKKEQDTSALVGVEPAPTLPILVLAWIYKNSGRNTTRTGGRVEKKKKKAHFWDLNSRIAVVLCLYTNCLNSTNLRIKYYTERMEERGIEMLQMPFTKLIKADQVIFFSSLRSGFLPQF